MPTRFCWRLALATYCFLRSFENREIRWAIAAGAAGALAMLGKYYSVFSDWQLLRRCGSVIRNGRLISSPGRPWVSATVMFIALVRICIGWSRPARARSPMRWHGIPARPSPSVDRKHFFSSLDWQ